MTSEEQDALRIAAEGMLAAFDKTSDALWLNSWALRPAYDALEEALYQDEPALPRTPSFHPDDRTTDKDESGPSDNEDDGWQTHDEQEGGERRKDDPDPAEEPFAWAYRIHRISGSSSAHDHVFDIPKGQKMTEWRLSLSPVNPAEYQKAVEYKNVRYEVQPLYTKPTIGDAALREAGPFAAEPNPHDSRWIVTLKGDSEVQFYGTQPECEGVRDVLNKVAARPKQGAQCICSDGFGMNLSCPVHKPE